MRVPSRLAGLTLIAAAALLIGASATQAATTTEGCLAQKRKAWGALRKCQGAGYAKQLVGKPADLAKCQAKFEATLAKLSQQASDAGIKCRYRDHGDTTVTDYDTGLRWEQKIDGGSAHRDVHEVRTWSNAMSEMVSAVNEWTNTTNPQTPGLAGYNDWRLPSIDELMTILDLNAPGCGSGSPCIDPIFGPTVAFSYWSATTYATDPGLAWGVGFGNGFVSYDFKSNFYYVRAVRGGL